ncbi:MAG: carboxypeptidase M32, partial [Planctomycetota bacterium]
MSHGATLNELKERVGTILDLKRVSALVGWDQQTMMPPAGNDARADQLATIDRFSHELFVSEETGKLLDQLAEHENELDPDSIDAALIRVTRRDWEKARRVPAELQAELTKAEVLGVMAWAEARRNS